MSRGVARFVDFEVDAVTLARRLLGQRLVRRIDGVDCGGIIVETEAYLGPDDQAAHTRNGRRTPRNETMWLGGGHAYVYFIYGMHHCMNLTCGSVGAGTAVLIRALEPDIGIPTLQQYRPSARSASDLCSGPGRLAQALAIDRSLDGEDVRVSDVLFVERLRRRSLPQARIESGPRIGVEYAGDWAERSLRFFVRGNPHVSRSRKSRCS